VDEKLASVLKELEHSGAENDARVIDRKEKMLNITPETGSFLSLLIQAIKARRVLEIGTSNGYSTLWLADAVQHLAGTVTTVEVLAYKADMARINFARTGLAAYIQLHLGDAGEFLRRQSEHAYDFLFLDADRDQYVAWWPDLQRVLAPGGLMVVDNALSHATEMGSFIESVCVTHGYITALVPLGKGELLVLKQA
jgi:predicted O-methyltransferase YrrM